MIGLALVKGENRIQLSRTGITNQHALKQPRGNGVFIAGVTGLLQIANRLRCEPRGDFQIHFIIQERQRLQRRGGAIAPGNAKLSRGRVECRVAII